MSCCGQKRMELKHEARNSIQNQELTVDSHTITEKESKVFEYTGDANLTLKGISSGTVYHFRFKGEKVEVNYYDSFAMMAEPDLKIA